MRSFEYSRGRSPRLRRVRVAVVALALGSLAGCSANHAFFEATRKGDLGTVRALQQDRPDLVFIQSSDGTTPLHWAAFTGHMDVAALLRRHGGHE